MKQLYEKDAKIPCTSCDNSDNQAVGRCAECNDFLCEKCAESHKSLRVLKHHHVPTLEELRSGKLTMHNLPEQEMCPKHKGEVLRFYCETCDEPICRDCTVVGHPRPDHKQTELKTAADERNDTLHGLLKKVKLVPKAIDIATAEDELLLKELEASEMKANNLYKTTAKKAEFENEKISSKRRKEIEAHRDGLQFRKARLCTAIEMTQQIT
ncbi:E3 ubiquitin-protein ligase TRIM33-like [Amphiura filiformis]|uniref:E3 ubiquitin-protein ligase TRIM33-like n=1 Tax=Amphiura filiformis TaxID=82378 RepID=UPI003B22830C